MHQSKLIHRHLASPSTVILEFEKPEGYSHKAGQYLMLALGENEPPKPYSLASAPHEETLKLHIKDTGDPQGMGHRLNKRVKINDPVFLEQAAGDMTIDNAPQRPILMIAGGVGFAPFRAILLDLIERGLTDTPITLFWGVSAEDELYDRETITRLKEKLSHFNFIPTFETAPADNLINQASSYKTGYVGDAVAENFEAYKNHHLFLAGPPQMAEHCLKALRKKGLDESLVACDYKHLLND